jgi:hypothetical protein
MPEQELSQAIDALLQGPFMSSVGRIRTGADYQHYVEDRRSRVFNLPPSPSLLGLAKLHQGQLTAASTSFRESVAFLKNFRATVPRADGSFDDDESEEERTLLALIDLIDQRPADIPGYCQAVAVKNVERLGLTKWWVPEPFVFDAPI